MPVEIKYDQKIIGEINHRGSISLPKPPGGVIEWYEPTLGGTAVATYTSENNFVQKVIFSLPEEVRMATIYRSDIRGSKLFAKVGQEKETEVYVPAERGITLHRFQRK